MKNNLTVQQKQKHLLLMKEMYYNYLSEGDDISRDFIKNYEGQEISYISDIFHEYADNNVSIYYDEQREFYYNNASLCEDALYEYDYNLNDLMKKYGSLDGVICKAGQIGEYKYIYDSLHNDFEIINKCLYIALMIKNNIFVDCESNIEEDIMDAIDNYLENFIYSNDVLLESIEYIDNYLELRRKNK